MDPQALSPVSDQTRLAELTEMTRHMGLGGTDGLGEFTHTELLIFPEEEQAAEPRIMSKCRK